MKPTVKEENLRREGSGKHKGKYYEELYWEKVRNHKNEEPCRK